MDAIELAVGSGRGGFSSGRAGFRNDSFRGHGNYGGGRAFSRNDRSWGEFSSWGRSSRGQGEGYQQAIGRGGRSSGVNNNANSS